MTSEHLRWCHLSKYEYVTLTERNSARKTGPQTFSNVVVPPVGQREHRRGLVLALPRPLEAAPEKGGRSAARSGLAKLLRLGLLLPPPGL